MREWPYQRTCRAKKNNMDDEKQSEGLAINELKRSEGWQIIERRIREEIASTLTELRRIDLDKRTLESVGSEYISKIERINGLERVLEIVQEIEDRYQNSHG
jgi:hypothetical protein